MTEDTPRRIARNRRCSTCTPNKHCWGDPASCFADQVKGHLTQEQLDGTVIDNARTEQ